MPVKFLYRGHEWTVPTFDEMTPEERAKWTERFDRAREQSAIDARALERFKREIENTRIARFGKR